MINRPRIVVPVVTPPRVIIRDGILLTVCFVGAYGVAVVVTYRALARRAARRNAQ
jgi:hypothetical protein